MERSFQPRVHPGAASNLHAREFSDGRQTQVIGINNTGWTDGFYVDQMGTTHGFTLNAGTFTTVDAPGTAFNRLLGINDSLTTVGYSSTDPTGATLQMSFKESGGTFTYISGFATGTGNNQAVGINNAGTAVGFYLDSMGVPTDISPPARPRVRSTYPSMVSTTSANWSASIPMPTTQW